MPLVQSKIKNLPPSHRFFRCVNCNAIFLQKQPESDVNQTCPRCQTEIFKLIPDPFLMSCPTCFEYWAPRVISLILNEGFCHCPRIGCNGLLTFQYSEAEMQPSKELSKLVMDKMKDAVEFQKKLKQKSEEDQEGASPGLESSQKSPSISIIPITDLASINQEPSIDETILDSLLTQFDKISVRNSVELREINNLLSLELVSKILTQVLVLHSQKFLVTRSSGQSVSFIGNLDGDLQTIISLTSYISQILKAFPNTQFIFLGGYFAQKWTDLFCFGILGALKLKYPKQILFLRGKPDFPDQYLSQFNPSQSFANLNSTFSAEPEKLKADTFSNTYSLLFGLVSYCPLFHVMQMNQNTIKIFAAHSGFPLDPESETPINVDSSLASFQGPVSAFFNLPKPLQFALQAHPFIDKTTNEYFFTKDHYFSFLKANDYRYMVRSNDSQSEAFLFQDLICTIYSSNSQVENRISKGMIVRLKAGKSPDLISMDQNLQDDLKNTYGIDL